MLDSPSAHRPGYRSASIGAFLLLTLLAGPGAAQLPKAPGTGVAVREFDRFPLGLVPVDLAGHTLDQYPGFTFTQSFYEGLPIEIAIDPERYSDLDAGSHALYVIANQSPGEQKASDLLVDVRGGPQLVSLVNGTLAGNAVVIDVGTLSGDAGIDFGVGLDIVLDVDGDGRLSGGDFVDGLGLAAGFYVVRDPADPGPLAVTETNYFVNGVKAGFEGQNTFYPTDISTLGKLPLVVVSHGNGHNYNWYNHIGVHLASYGFVVMSHENNTGPGIDNASITTLDHTDAFLGSLGTIEGGVFQGHIDNHKIIWIGHSRGGEGIVRAYDKLADNIVTPDNYGVEDIIGLSSIAPTVFLNAGLTDPHDVPFSLWTGAADSDVNGCANTPITFTYLIHERSDGDRYSVHLHGAGHGAFHNGGGSLVAKGPCQVSRTETHAIMRSYLLPLVYKLAFHSPAAPEFLWRQHEEFFSPNLSLSSCVVVNKTYQMRTSLRFVVDDFQDTKNFALSSSGGNVISTVGGSSESAFYDPDSNFTYLSGQPMNSMTYSINGESRRGMAYGWTADQAIIEWEIISSERDLSNWRWISFRTGQLARHPNTIAEAGDVTFEVTLRDEAGRESSINIGAYGGGVEEPYQRSGCGTGTGWSTFFETIRLPLVDFGSNGNDIDLSRIEAVRFSHGSSYGNSIGRLVLDDLELIRE